MPRFGKGGWALLLAAAALLALFTWRTILIVGERGERRIGDGRTIESYGFDLSTLIVPRETLVASGLPRDGIPALVLPRILDAVAVDSLARAGRRGKYLVSGDRVIGVAIGGHARAYPLSVLNWHEVVNDTVGGRPIAVTYSPLCDAAVVFDRRHGDGAREFGVSGLLYNSDLVLYDRQPERGGSGPSLWSQLMACAIGGPAAARGESLAVVPAALVRWADWRARHPSTSVLARNPAFYRRYRRDPYVSYFGNDLLRFPVDPLPPHGLPRKTQVVAVRARGIERVFPLPWIADRAGGVGIWRTELGGLNLRFEYHDDPPTVWVSSSTAGGDERPTAGGVEKSAGGGDESPTESVEDLTVRHAFWFAWYATHPDAVLAGGPPAGER